MKPLKWLGIALVVYVGIVVVFESLIGYFQPSNEATLSLTVYEEDGEPHQRVLSRIEHGDQLYVAVNHWPRSWYHTLQENARVDVAYGEREFSGTAVVVTDEAEYASINADRPLSLVFKFLTGFPPPLLCSHRTFELTDSAASDGCVERARWSCHASRRTV